MVHGTLLGVTEQPLVMTSCDRFCLLLQGVNLWINGIIVLSNWALRNIFRQENEGDGELIEVPVQDLIRFILELLMHKGAAAADVRSAKAKAGAKDWDADEEESDNEEDEANKEETSRKEVADKASHLMSTYMSCPVES